MNWQAEAYREVDETVQRMIADLPRRPRLWREQKAFTEYIMRVIDIKDYSQLNLWEMERADDPPTAIDKWLMSYKYHPPTSEELEARAGAAIEDFRAGRYEPLFDAFRYGRLRYGMTRYSEGLELIIAKAKGTFKSPRSKSGPLPEPVWERESRSILPEAENTFCGICGLLCDLFPEQEGKQIRDRALYLTVVRVNSLLGDNKSLFGVTTKKLNWFMQLNATDPRRFGIPKLKLNLHLKRRRQRVSVSQYLSSP